MIFTVGGGALRYMPLHFHWARGAVDTRVHFESIVNGDHELCQAHAHEKTHLGPVILKKKNKMQEIEKKEIITKYLKFRASSNFFDHFAS